MFCSERLGTKCSLLIKIHKIYKKRTCLRKFNFLLLCQVAYHPFLYFSLLQPPVDTLFLADKNDTESKLCVKFFKFKSVVNFKELTNLDFESD